MEKWLAIVWVVALFSAIKFVYGSNTFSTENRKKQKHPNDFFRYIYHSLHILLLVTIVSHVASIPYVENLKFEAHKGLVGAGLLSGILGALGLYFARKKLGSNYSDCGDSFSPMSLEIRGIYAYIRHPIYTSNVLIFFSIFTVMPSAISLTMITVLYFSYLKVIDSEERSLIHEFSDYSVYQSQTGKMFPKLIFSKALPVYYSEVTVSANLHDNLEKSTEEQKAA